jgi:hypothetical protein
MNIKSNKEKKNIQNINVGKFFSGLIIRKLYWFPFLIWIMATGINILLDGSWGIHLTITSIIIVSHIIIVWVAESNRISTAQWNDKVAHYSYTSLIGIPLIMVGLSYWSIMHPMYDDYKHSERIDRVLSLGTVKLFYNDSNRIFILFVEGQKEPLVINHSGHSDTYNRLKADYLDGKIKVLKKETKSWTDNNSSIQYYLDGYDFD